MGHFRAPCLSVCVSCVLTSQTLQLLLFYWQLYMHCRSRMFLKLSFLTTTSQVMAKSTLKNVYFFRLWCKKFYVIFKCRFFNGIPCLNLYLSYFLKKAGNCFTLFHTQSDLKEQKAYLIKSITIYNLQFNLIYLQLCAASNILL